MSNKKRSIIFGLCTAVFVGSLYLLNIETVEAGCAGNCMTCHPKLENDSSHKSLGTCYSCHDGSKTKLFSIKPQSNEGCGNNCFTCHNQWPKNGYHADLDNCKNCHKIKG